MRTAARALAALLASAGAASACDEGDQALFSCHVIEEGKDLDASQKGFSLCGGHPEGNLENWTRAYYEFWTAKGTEFRYPKDPRKGRATFFTMNYSENGLYRFRTRFNSGGYKYVIYLDEAPAATEPDTINGPSAGVEVWKGKKRVAVHDCSEAPETYFSYIFRATTCDLDNPKHELACDPGNVPELK